MSNLPVSQKYTLILFQINSPTVRPPQTNVLTDTAGLKLCETYTPPEALRTYLDGEGSDAAAQLAQQIALAEKQEQLETEARASILQKAPFTSVKQMAKDYMFEQNNGQDLASRIRGERVSFGGRGSSWKSCSGGGVVVRRKSQTISTK